MPPLLRSWPGFLEEMWREQLLSGHSGSMLLNSDQEHLLWRRTIEKDRRLETLTSAQALATLAQATWSRLCAFRAEDVVALPSLRDFGATFDDGSVDAAAFARWASEFRKRCVREDLLTVAELSGRLTASITSAQSIARHRRIATAGFDEFTPAQAYLLDALRSAGVEVIPMEQSAAQQKGVIARAADENEELQACARWCVSRARTGQRVAVVVPGIEASRPPLARALRGEFAAAPLTEDLRTTGLLPFAFAAGGPAAREPLVVSALSILRLAAGALPLNDASRLLQSRYFAQRRPKKYGADAAISAPDEPSIELEWSARAECDAYRLRRSKRLRPEITLRELRRITDDARWSAQLHRVRGALRSMQRTLAKHEAGTQSFGRWGEWMRKLLAAAGWGAPASGMSAEERQATETWDGALDALATLSFTGERVSYLACLDVLEQIIARRAVPTAADDALIEVTTADDIAGSEFDAIWCLGAGETSWPAFQSTLALLPRPMQRELRMPGTDRAQEAAATALGIHRLQAGAEEVVFSYAEHTAAGDQRPASVLREQGHSELPALAVASGLPTEMRDATRENGAGPFRRQEQAALECVEDCSPIARLPDRVLAGGAGLLATQAACGFRAFAEHRLSSSAPDGAELGLDARETGNLVHLALQRLWTELGSRATLNGMTTSERDSAVERAIAGASESFASRETSAWSAAFLRVERKRLQRLLQRWLNFELARPDFMVEGHEMQLDDVGIGPLRLSLRIDRVDRAAGARVLIDYKTGTAKVKDWEGDRPDAPQLPLYAVLSAAAGVAKEAGDGGSPAPLGAVAFAKVKLGKYGGIEGIADRAGLLSADLRSVRNDFAAQVQGWRSVLEGLATAFANGDARVNPKSYPETCTFCEQRMLCRLDVRTLEEDDVLAFSAGTDGEDD